MTKEFAFIKQGSLPVECFREEALCLFLIKLPWKRENSIYFSHIQRYLNTFISTRIYICICVYIHTYIYICVCVYVCVCVFVLLRVSKWPYHLKASLYVMQRNHLVHRRKKDAELCWKRDCSVRKGFRLSTWLYFCHMHLVVTPSIYSEDLFATKLYPTFDSCTRRLSARSVL